MSTALTILLLTVSSPASDDPFAPEVASAIRQALGPDTHVMSSPQAELPSDADAVARAERLKADAVVEVRWQLPDHLGVTIRLERASSDRWVERQIGFQEIDEPVERCRTVGFTVASMLPEGLAQSAEPTPRARPVPEPGERDTRSPPRDTESSEEALRARGSMYNPNSLSGTAVAAFGVGDYGTSVGGSIDYRRRLGRPFAFRIGAAARAGQDPPARAVSRFFSGALGLAWHAWTSERGAAALSFRLDALAVLTQYSRVSSTDSTTIDKFKWMPGADLLVEACYFFTPGAAVVAAGGGEAVFGRTDIVVGGQVATSYRPLHPLVELGLRVGF